MAIAPDPIERHDFDTGTLMAQHPPVWRHPNKQVVFDIACGPGDSHDGRLGYSRWAAMPLPAAIEPETAGGLVLGRDRYFDYEPVLDPATGIEWHVNFADPRLFVAYGSSLFVQDEMQVAEHPALGALKEALTADGHRAATVDMASRHRSWSWVSSAAAASPRTRTTAKDGRTVYTATLSHARVPMRSPGRRPASIRRPSGP